MNAAFNQHPNTAGAAAASSSTASLHQNVAGGGGGGGPSLSPEHEVAPRKRGGRGPGKKEKDKPAVSVRWEEADLTDRLLNSIAANPRWAAVFTQAAPDQSRASTGVPKRDLQREIARHLFKDNEKFDLDDTRVVEALAVSVKNKLFKIQTLYTECKAELGPLGTLESEADIPNDPAQAQIWARVKEKFPQFFLARDLMFRAPVPRTASKKEDHYAKRRESLASPTASNLPGTSQPVTGSSAMRKTNGRALSSEHIHYHPSHPLTLSIGAPHPTNAPPLTGRIPLGTTAAPSPSLIPSSTMNSTYHPQRISLPNTPAYTLNSALIPVANPPAPTPSTAPPQEDVHAIHIQQHSPTPSPLYYTNYQPPFNHPAGPTGETSEQLYSDSLRSTKNAAELDINRSSPHFPPIGIQQQHHQQQPQQGRIALTTHSTPPRDPRTGEFVPPNPFPLHPERTAPVVPQPQSQPFPAGPAAPQVAMEGVRGERRPPSRDVSASPPLPSPPLGQSLASLIGMLDDRKRKREDEWIALKKRKYDEQRQQRIDRERERQHEREMLRLRIRLARVERGDLSRSPRELASPEAEAERVAAEAGDGGYHPDFGPGGLGGERQDETYGLREVQGGRFGPSGNGRSHGEGMGGEEDGEGEVDVDPHSGDGNHPGRSGNGVPNERPLGP